MMELQNEKNGCLPGLSEGGYRTIFNSANDAIIIHDIKDGRVLEVNHKMLEMYGYTREEALGLDLDVVSEGLSPYSQVDAAQWIEKAVAGEPQLFEWRAKKKSGKIFWVEVNLKRITFDGGDRLLAIVRNISERKLAEKALKESEAQFRSVIDNTSDSVIITDETGKITYWNRGSQNIFGYTGDEIIGASINMLLPENVKRGKDEALTTYDDVRNSTEFGTVQKSYARRKDGSIFPLDVTLSCWERDEKYYFCSIIRDISEREKVEQRFRAIFNSSVDSIIISDSDGKIISCNPATRDVFGYDPAELIGKSVKVLLPQENRNEVDDLLKKKVLLTFLYTKTGLNPCENFKNAL